MTLSVPPFPVSSPSSNSAHIKADHKVGNWKSFSSSDARLLNCLHKMEKKDPALKTAIDSLSRSPLEIEFSFKDRAAFDADTRVQFSVKNAEGGVYIKESDTTGQSHKRSIELVCTANDKFALPEQEIAFAIKTIDQKSKTGVWPPQFAILNRPQGVSQNTLQALKNIPVSELRRLGGALIHDLSNEGYGAYHGKESVKVVAPIMTAKVAQGDTLMVQYGLEREVQRGNIVFIDGSEPHHDKNKPAYANVGGLLREIAIHSGAAGFITNGFIRDSSEYLLKDSASFFACYAKGLTPNGPTKLEAGALNLPLQIDGHTINSGDIFVAQGKELLVIPAENADKLLQFLEGKITHTDEETGGALPSESSNNQVDSSSAKAGKSTWNRLSQQLSRLGKPSIPLRDTPVTKKLLDMMKHVPPAEYADAYSTLKPAQTTGIGLPLYAKALETKSAGMALIVDGTWESIQKGLSAAKEKHTLVIHAGSPDDVVLNDALLNIANNKKIAAIVTNGTVALSSESAIPVYATTYAEGNPSLKEGKGKGILSDPIQMEGVPIHPGDVIVGDEDGIAAIPQGLEEFGMRGGHAIASKEKGTLESIRNGTAAKRTLPRDLYPSSNSANANFLLRHIEERDAPVQTARGSSGLTIPQPQGIRVGSGAGLENADDPAIIAAHRAPAELRNGETIKGIPSQVMFDKASPAVFALAKPSRNPFRSGKDKTYVSGIQGTDFLRAMKAMAKGVPIKVDADGTVTFENSSLKGKGTDKTVS